MHSITDVLGDEGRKALEACVKVKIYGKPENTRRYHWAETVQRLKGCYAGLRPCNAPNKSWTWLPSLDDLMLPNPNCEKTYDIIEIYDALVKFDERPYVEKYPKPGPRFQEMKEAIDKRRASIQEEWEEATADPDARHQYSWLVAQRRVRNCFAGNFAGDVAILEKKRDPNEPYNILEIHDAVVRYEEMSFVEKYPLDSCRNERIDAQRANIERKYKNLCSRARSDQQCSSETHEQQNQGEDEDKVEMKFFCPLASRMKNTYQGQAELGMFHIWFLPPRARDPKKKKNPSITGKFCQGVAKAEWSVKTCYAGCFPEHSHILPIKVNENGLPQVTESYTIGDIHKAVQYFDEKKRLQKYPEDEGPGSDELKKLIEACSFSLKEEYHEFKSSLPRYSAEEAESRVRGCFASSLQQKRTKLFPFREGEIRISDFNQTYDVFDIYKMVLHFEKEEEQRANEDTRALERPKIIREHKNALTMEYQEAKSKLHGFSRSEAERQVRDCFAGCFLEDTDIFPNKKEKDGIPKIHQTYDILEIKEALDHFDFKKLLEKHRREKEPACDKRNEMADHNRTELEQEYAEATAKIEIEHGSGFIISNYFVITNKHVVEDALYDKTKGICVSNAVIGELPCEVIHHDAGKDLALLFCRELNARKNGICPLQLSNQSLLPGMQIFAFGFPMSHTDETALFVNGYVSGSKKTLSGHSLAVLNCALNSGNSGGPILCGDEGQLKVVGVATQKHFKHILTFEEREKIEKIRESLQTSTITSVPDDAIESTLHWSFPCHRSPDPRQTPMFLLTLKLYDALETHSQFNLSNALPGRYIVEFIKECPIPGHHEDKKM